MNKNTISYKIIIGVLCFIIVVCIAFIYILFGEISFLKENLSRTTDMIQQLEDRIAKIEGVNVKSSVEKSPVEKSNYWYIAGGAFVIVSAIALTILLGGEINFQGMAKALNLLGEQSRLDLSDQSKMIGANYKETLKTIDNLNRGIVAEITATRYYLAEKLNVILHAIQREGVDLNSILASIPSDRNDWE